MVSRSGRANLFLASTAALLLALPAAPARGSITAITITPARANIQVSAATTVIIVWRVTRTAAPPSGPAVVSSPSGEFRVGGTVLGTVNRVLSRSVPGSPTGTEVVTFTDTVLVPRSVVFQATRRGFATVVYVRTFRDSTASGAPVAATMALAITGAGGARFAVSRISLKFDDRSRVRVLSREEPLQALSEINFSGSGLLRAAWEIAGPPSTAGAPVFRPLRIVRRSLAGSQLATLVSPRLPTAIDGLYLVRLRIIEPVLDFATPVLRYYVTPAGPGPPEPSKVRIRLREPETGKRLAAATTFSWHAVAGARAYQLEFFLDEPAGPAGPPDPASYGDVLVEPERPLVAGVIVPGKVTETRLRRISRERLRPERRYRWRVKAIGDGGAVIGESNDRRIFVPSAPK